MCSYTKYVVLFKRGPTHREEEDDWNLETNPFPDSVGLECLVASNGGDLNGRPLWAVLLCRTCREQVKNGGSWISPCRLLWWRNPEYDGPIPPLRNPATDLVCIALTKTPEIKERMRAEAAQGLWRLREFVMASLFPPWAEGAEAGLREQLAKIALDQVNWWEVRAALGIPATR
jgi:hypothetical protein